MKTSTDKTRRQGHGTAIAALALLALGTAACSSGSDASAEEAAAAVPAAATVEPDEPEAPEAEASEPEEQWDQEARDGHVVFRVRGLRCHPIGVDDEGNAIKANGKGCEALVEIVNESDEEVVLRQRSMVLQTASGEEHFAQSHSPLFFTPRIAPSESVSKEVGWLVADYDDLVTEARFHAGDESEGAVFTVEDDTAGRAA